MVLGARFSSPNILKPNRFEGLEEGREGGGGGSSLALGSHGPLPYRAASPPLQCTNQTRLEWTIDKTAATD